jgi:hypothetical protein
MPSFSQRHPSERALRARALRVEEQARYDALSPEGKLKSDKRKAKEALKAEKRKTRRQAPAATAQKSRDRAEVEARATVSIDCGSVKLRDHLLIWETFQESKSKLARALNAGSSDKFGSMVERSRSIDATTTAEVDTSGQLIQQSRSTATRTAAGAVIAGPVGAIVGLGAKKKETLDQRRVYLAVESADWSELFVFGGNLETSARRLAQTINRVARQMSDAST